MHGCEELQNQRGSLILYDTGEVYHSDTQPPDPQPLTYSPLTYSPLTYSP